MEYPNSPVRVGDERSAIVKAIQARLIELGVDRVGDDDLAVDGVFGPDTEAAVCLFQARGEDEQGRPLDIDGIVGPSTWQALFGEDTRPSGEADAPLLTKVLQVAAGEVGVLEEPPGSNSGPKVNLYLSSVGLNPGYAWCAAFVYWCFREAAGSGDNPCPRTAGVHDLWRRCGVAGKRRYTPAQIAARPELVRPGQLFFLNAGGGLGHVGFIEVVRGVYLTTIEGNTNGGGSREGIGVFRRTTRRIREINLGVADVTQTIA